MDSKKKNEIEQEYGQPPKKEALSGQPLDKKKLVRTSQKAEQPLEERRVVRKTEGAGPSFEGSRAGVSGKELDLSLARRADRDKPVEPPQEEKPARGDRRSLNATEEKLRNYGRVGQWFLTLCWMNIPVFGFFYMLVLAIRKKTPPQKKSFAIAYILYRMLVLLLAGTILFVLYRVGLSFIEEILRYAGS